MISIQCAICGNKQKLHILYKSTVRKKAVNASTFSARRTPDRVHYRFVKCQNCGLIFSTPIFPQNEIVNLYKNSGFEYSIESSFLKKTYGTYLAKAINIRVTKNLRLLDIGCGNGFFLEQAEQMGITNVYGVEPGKETVAKAPRRLQKRITVDIFKKGQFKSNSFDVVCCFHTLDHIVDPNKFLKIVYDVLKKDGRAYFIVHDTNGLSVKIFKEKSPIFDIEHIYLFNRENLSLIFQKNGFRVLNVFPVKNSYPLSYWMRMSPIPKRLKSILSFVLDKFSFLNVTLSLQAGNIGIIAEK